MENEVKYLYLDDIIPNRFQPRENFDEQALKELAVSIKEHGVIQPIVVRQIGEKYEIIAGERRYKASTMAGLTKIPAIIKNLDDKESSKVALIENLQRRDLTPIEEARTYQKILELDALTQEELAKTMGKSQSAVANKLRLLSLTDEVQDALLHEQISERHARALLNVTDPKRQVELLNKVISTRMTVRELDEEIKNGSSSTSNNENSIGTMPNLSNADPKVNNSFTGFTGIKDILKPATPSEPVQSQSPVLEPTTNFSEPPKPKEEPIGGSGFLAGMNLESSMKPSTKQSNGIGLENDLYKNFNVPVKEEKAQEKEPDQLFPSFSGIESIQTPSPKKDVTKTVTDIKNTIENMKKAGNKIETEEFDFEDFYQIVIRIDKD